jgi:hypothetical protein
MGILHEKNWPKKAPVTKKRVLDSTTNLKHLMDLHRVEFSANPESNYNPDLLFLCLIMFSHRFSDFRSDTMDAYTKSIGVIT